jgi:sporulation protein YlmC with PRC-barrel domain
MNELDCVYFRFTLLSVTKQKSITHLNATETADGEYIICKVKAKNISDEEQWFPDESSVLYDKNGIQYRDVSRIGDIVIASCFDNLASDSYIEPKKTVVGYLVFDVPTGLSFRALLISDSDWECGGRHVAVFDLKDQKI